MDAKLEEVICRASGAEAVESVELLQELWSGYGAIRRCFLRGGERASVVVKDIRVDGRGAHPRGWDGDRSHQRKRRSYEVEHAWYRDWAGRCGSGCRVPRLLGAAGQGVDDLLLVLEDLDAAGYAGRPSSLDVAGVHACLGWLAHFHATFIGVEPAGLWSEGCYWHLATRPDELAAMPAGRLRAAATQIDARLCHARWRTLVHGDAKLANFCFAADGRVAAVDFQYVGGGCGMKDVAYFLGSCLDEARLVAEADTLVDGYFAELRAALPGHIDADALEAEWRGLHPWAWADFSRFLLGWSPGHWKLHGYTARMTDQVLAAIDG